MRSSIFYSHGKLLLTGEYIVLDGAKALATPTRQGQYLCVKPNKEAKIRWKSYDADNSIWYEDSFLIKNISSNSNNDISNTLITILKAAKELNPDFLSNSRGYNVTTRLTFPRHYGLGSSSTLIANIAKWAKINPYELLWKSFTGSAYDIACANSNSPLVYKISNNNPETTPIYFNPVFKEHIYFVYLNQKQNSREGIKHYKSLNLEAKNKVINLINEITDSIIKCNTLEDFNSLLNRHEQLMSNLIKLPTVKEQLFCDYTKGSIKSLGAWGGDFVLTTVKEKYDLEYFKNKGYNTIISYKDMIL